MTGTRREQTNMVLLLMKHVEREHTLSYKWRARQGIKEDEPCQIFSYLAKNVNFIKYLYGFSPILLNILVWVNVGPVVL